MGSPDDHMWKREIEKANALTAIAGLLHLIQSEHRNPDHWERVHLASAFAAVFSGCYGVAATEVQLAVIPRRISVARPRFCLPIHL
jgi:hypothetical protein